MSGRPVRTSPNIAEQEVAVGDEERGADREGETDDREAVGGDPDCGAGPGRPVRALARHWPRQRPSSIVRASLRVGDGRPDGLPPGRSRAGAGEPAPSTDRAPDRVQARSDAEHALLDRAPGVADVAAKTFPTEKIRNVALVGHGGAGKTSLAEALLFAAGPPPAWAGSRTAAPSPTSTPRRQRRQISVSLALAPFEFEGHKINVIDTPGYADFVGDVAAALRAADLAVFVVSAVEGVEVQTEIAWRHGRRARPPRARSSSTSSTASARRSRARSTS